MLRKLLLASILVPIIGALAAIGVVISAGWQDTQTASGNVTVSSTTPDLLYICEPTGPDPDPCPADDSGADEIIFETDEQMLPTDNQANWKEWRIRLRNLDPVVQWDVDAVAVSITETADPGDDCTNTPSYDIWTVNKDNDHFNFSGTSGVQFQAMDHTSGTNSYGVHLGPNENDDMRIRVWIPGSFPVACQGGTWDINIAWTAEVH